MNWLAKTTKFKPRTIASWPSGLLTPTIVAAPSVPDPDARARTLAAYELRKHIDANVVYYNRMVALAQDSETRALEWIDKQFLAAPLLNQIDNHPIGAFADRLAYRWTTAPPNLPAAPIYIPQPIEAWVALPTRGVFAEAQLGHCSGCEVIDSTRFWDWQKSPCPERAPTIADVSTATRNQNIIPPSGVTFPTSLVSIQSPPSEPDPTGISDLLKAITTGTAFRDMSGLEQLTTILSALIAAVKPAASSSSSSASKPKSSSSSSSG
jgi:hypothetical protein